LPSGNQKRVIIGFCPIKQSSISPIVCFHQSNQNSRPTLHGKSKAIFADLCLGLTSGGLLGASRRFCFPVIRCPPIKNDSSAIL